MIKKFLGKLFNHQETAAVPTTLKTRTQLIREGKGSYIPKRSIYGTTRLK
jgi:hypothetical protein